MNIDVLKAGAQTTLQDGGRVGWRHLGVGVAGALDAYSATLANRLVGNGANEAVLEIALTGPTLRFHAAARIAIAGADIDARVDAQALPGWRPIELPADSVLQLGACRRGARAYLAVRGGFDLVPVLGSAATDLRAGFGGHQGRALRIGDLLRTRVAQDETTTLHIAPWWIDPRPDLDLDRDALLHVLPGRDATRPLDALALEDWRVGAASDRQGVRLDGAPLSLAQDGERISEPVAPGTIQLPPDGRPIVLLADAQTVGGYPCIGHVIGADLPRLAQCRPGDTIRFAPIDRAPALARRRAQAQRLARIELAIAQRALG